MTKKTTAKKPASKKSTAKVPQLDRALVTAIDLSHSLCAKVDVMCGVQDAALMQILAIAKLAKVALDRDMECAMNDVANDAAQAFAAILEIATLANDKLDFALTEIGDARLRTAA